MTTSSNMRLFLCTLLLPVMLHADLTVDAEHKAVVDTSDLQLVAPSVLTTVGLPTVVGALVGAGLSEGNRNVTAGFAAFFALIGGREYFAYQSAYNQAYGLKLAGAAAEHNLAGVQALLTYSKGWYLFKSNDGCTFYKQPIGSPLEVDATGKTALHYAAAVNDEAIIKAILAAAPTTVTKFETTGRSKTTTAPTHTLKVGQSTTGGIVGAVAGVLSGTVKKEATTTAGGHQEHVSEVAIHQTYVDFKDLGNRTAANLAARTRSVQALLYLADRGADIDIADNSKQSPRTISHNDPAMKAAIDRIEGK
jgi:hypothetical protein